jgi:hypothetical protein
MSLLRRQGHGRCSTDRRCRACQSIVGSDETLAWVGGKNSWQPALALLAGRYADAAHLPHDARRVPRDERREDGGRGLRTTGSFSVIVMNYTEAMWEIRASGLMIGEGETGPA